jgi:hypothetical protein
MGKAFKYFAMKEEFSVNKRFVNSAVYCGYYCDMLNSKPKI